MFLLPGRKSETAREKPTAREKHSQNLKRVKRRINWRLRPRDSAILQGAVHSRRGPGSLDCRWDAGRGQGRKEPQTRGRAGQARPVTGRCQRRRSKCERPRESGACDIRASEPPDTTVTHVQEQREDAGTEGSRQKASL